MRMEQVIDGLQFPEGPVAMADGSVVLVEMRRRTLTRVTPEGRRETIAELGGGPNGAAIGPDGCLSRAVRTSSYRFQIPLRRTSALVERTCAMPG